MFGGKAAQQTVGVKGIGVRREGLIKMIIVDIPGVDKLPHAVHIAPIRQTPPVKAIHSGRHG